MISATAIVGRGIVVTLLAYLSMVQLGWPAPPYDAVMLVLAAVTASQIATMLRHGPRTRCTVAGAMPAVQAGTINDAVTDRLAS